MFEWVIRYRTYLNKNKVYHREAFYHPTLSGIKINDIVKCVKDLDCSLFVDDFGIFIISKNMETTEFKLQRCLNNIEDWATENGFKFSKTKTQCVHFCQIRQLHLDPLTIYGSPIPVVSAAKFLGLLFDNKYLLYHTSKL